MPAELVITLVEPPVLQLALGAPITVNFPGPAVPGQDGAPGPAGADGAQPYIHTQASAATQWTINHNLGRTVAVTVFDSGGNVVIGSVLRVSANQVILTFNLPLAGQAYLL